MDGKPYDQPLTGFILVNTVLTTEARKIGPCARLLYRNNVARSSSGLSYEDLLVNYSNYIHRKLYQYSLFNLYKNDKLTLNILYIKLGNKSKAQLKMHSGSDM